MARSVAVTTLGDRAAITPRSLTALNLAGLSRIEAIGAALIAAVGIAVLGAFLVIERRREFATLEAVGAEWSQIRTGPAIEVLAAGVGGIAIGVPVGLLLAVVDVRVLGLFFTLPPPLITVPVWQLVALVALVAVMSMLALAGVLDRIRRIEAPALLREP
jgi:putative ABC transport system permease protein